MPGVATVLPKPVRTRGAMIAPHPEDHATVKGAPAVVRVVMNLTMPGYFDMLGVPLMRGTDVAPASDTSATMVIGSNLARTLWGDADPIGKRFIEVSSNPAEKREIVVTGVYDSRYFDPDGYVDVYRSAKKMLAGTYQIRTTPPASDLAIPIRQLVREELPGTPIEPLLTLAYQQAKYRSSQHQIQAGVGAAGALILVVSSIGLYGAVALGVGTRRREIGIRMALGARASQVVALFYTGGVRLGVIGLTLGLPLSLVAVYFLDRKEGDTAHVGVMLLGGIVASVVLVVASVATLIPASRAARVDPVTVLRTE
jgi:ABC-type antimicrobial peptide transport system permease subunit